MSTYGACSWVVATPVSCSYLITHGPINKIRIVRQLIQISGAHLLKVPKGLQEKREDENYVHLVWRGVAWRARGMAWRGVLVAWRARGVAYYWQPGVVCQA